MSVQAVKQERSEIRAAFDTAEALQNLYAALDEATARAESFERAAAISQQENENLLAQLRRSRGERDHYLRAFTALSSQLKGIGTSMLEAVKMAEVHSYGEHGPRSEQQGRPQERMPSIVARGPAMRGSPIKP